MAGAALTIVVIRHAESAWNAAGRWQGQADPPLSEVGVAQAAAVGARLAGTALDAVWASDLERAVVTAEAVAAPHGLSITQDPAFRELDVGTWAGHTSAEIAETHPTEWSDYRAGVDIVRGGGESLHDMHVRVGAAFDTWVRSMRDAGHSRVALVTHGGVVRGIAMHVLGCADRTAAPLPLAAPQNTALATVTYAPPRVQLGSYNDATHLAAAADTALG